MLLMYVAVCCSVLTSVAVCWSSSVVCCLQEVRMFVLVSSEDAEVSL